MKVFRYFDLGFYQEEAELGTKKPSTKKKRDLKRFLATILVYVFIWLGILGQRIMELQQTGSPISWINLGQGFPLVALIIATTIFPVVFPKTFVKMPARLQKDGVGWFFVQLCVAFQNGFFWQSLLSLITPK